MNEIRKWLETVGNGHYFFFIFPVCLVILLILLRGRRMRFVVPGLLITLAILNPLFYRHWVNLSQSASVFWRTLWVIPVIAVVACVVPCITERIDRGWLKGAVVVAGVGLTALSGTFLYSGTGGAFVIPSSNTAKLPEQVVDIADYLTSLEAHPRVAIQTPLGFYIRQYTGDIDTMFGRDIVGYILDANSEAQRVNDELDDPKGDMGLVATALVNHGYDYLVLNDDGRKEALQEAGFEFLKSISGYGVYRMRGMSDLVKQRNELGQVMSITTVDSQGRPVNGDRGYATVNYEYDSYGNIIREFRTDVDGNGVANLSGAAGYERKYDRLGHLLMERDIDSAGVPVVNPMGYAELRRTYRGNNIVRESYFDTVGNLVNRTDTLYASVRMAYDKQNRWIESRYYDAQGDPVNSYLGYARISLSYDGDYAYTEAYYDADDNPAMASRGYASVTRAYDEHWRLSSEAYFDTDGRPINCLNGYAAVLQGYDNKNNIVWQRFLDDAGKPVVTASGYAEVKREFAGTKLTYEAYFGTDGAPLMQPAGHYAIAQEWKGENLIARIYLDAAGKPMLRSDGYSKAVWTQDGKGTWNIHLEDLTGTEIPLEGRNLAVDIRFGPDGWSEWMTPTPNTFNSCFNLGYVNLGSRQQGDVYTSQLEVEFRDVSASSSGDFYFWAQGAQDGRWFTGNVWSASLIDIKDAPEDGVYRFRSDTTVEGAMTDISKFEVGFRCDYWGSGSFRVRYVKIEKGNTAGSSQAEQAAEPAGISEAWSPGV